MKLVPRHNEVIGRVVVERPQSNILRIDATKNTTKFVLVDAVGDGAANSGIKVGDIVIPKKVNQLMLEGGAIFRPFFEETEAAIFARELRIEDLHVQIDSGSEYVPFDSERAAKNLCGSEEVSGVPV